ncbi:MAG: PIN domain-containing protein [Thermoplasmatales archaeon]|nr:PIN domain-containing protein [Thermoplasmatales archaeon]
MEVVLDSNVLFRMLISRGDIIELVFNTNLKIYAPQRLWEEFRNNKKEILSKSNLSKKDFQVLSSLISNRITFVRLEEYKKYLPKAKKLLKRHEKDEDFIALCLLKCCKLWTYESRLFEIGFGISTKEISNILS